METATAANPLKSWLGAVQAELDGALRQALYNPDERQLDALWTSATEDVSRYSLRPAKRLRPALLLAGYSVGGGAPSDGVWRFAAGMELLHTFLLVHDDVADQAELRRGGPSLHRMLAPGRRGEDLAVVAGDHLFARSIEVMLGSGLPHAASAVTWFLGVCRHTAVGQYLDLQLSSAPLREVTLFQTLKVALLKTARYGFVAPLVCGAQLAGADASLIDTLERVGRHAGTAYQLRDDLIGLFGDPSVSGKPDDSDVIQGKRTFPVIAAWVRANRAQRRALEKAWVPGARAESDVQRARDLVESLGGRAATQRVIDRHTRSALKALEALPPSSTVDRLRGLLSHLARRSA